MIASAFQPGYAAEPAPATLPGGATSLQETFSDWRVGCVMQGGVKRCSLGQEQVNQQTRQRVIAAEMTIAGEKLEGVLLLPFGLLLERGVTLQIDEQTAPLALKFRTCLPGGCLVPLTFDARMTTALRAGSVLKVRASADNGQEQMFPLSLKGFGPALDRVATLSK